MGIFLLIPFFLVRFVLLALLDKQAVQRVAYFAPLQNGERGAYWLYQLSNLAIFVCLCFIRIRQAPPLWFYTGTAFYTAGVVLLLVSVINFAAPSESGINRNGLYRFSRNPMYMAYFWFFLGCGLLCQSILLFVFLAVFQISAHWIILAEERWCIRQFGDEYLQYMKKVRRYI